MDKIIQMASQLQKGEEQNAQMLRDLQNRVNDSSVVSQLRTLEEKERMAANQLGQMVSQLNQLNVRTGGANVTDGGMAGSIGNVTGSTAGGLAGTTGVGDFGTGNPRGYTGGTNK